MAHDLLQRVQRFDAARSNLPGEHWLAFGSGVALWLATRRHPSITVRLLASLAGTLLVARAVSGKDVPPLLAKLPFAGRPSRGRLDLLG